MSSSAPKILFVGATGYIGGSALASVLKSASPALRTAHIGALLRDTDGSRTATLKEAYGDRVTAIPFGDLDDTAHIEQLASDYDIIVNSAPGFHPSFGAALVRGLAKRKAASSSRAQTPFMVHTSGTSNLADHPLSGTAFPDREFDDANGTAVYDFEKAEEQRTPYGQRTVELAVVDGGLKHGVNTLVIMTGNIYGVGTGLFNQRSMQIPAIARATIERGHGVVLGNGAGVWDNVHVEDLGDLYALVVVKYLEDSKSLPSGKEGIIFSGTRRHTWRELSQGVADAAHARGKIASTALTELPYEKGGELFMTPEFAELGLASNSKTVASVGKRLGWQPKHGDASWKRGFEEEVDAILKQ